MRLRVAIASIALGLASLPAPAATLYKSVAPDGSLMFSDTPPPAGARILEQREIRHDGNVTNNPDAATGRLMGAMEQMYDGDEALARANQKVDLAEHALALARRETWSVRDGLRLAAKRMTRADEERIAFYKRELDAARRSLVDLLRRRQATPLEPGAPRVVSGPGSNTLAAAFTPR